jgi:hypothetical protein
MNGYMYKYFVGLAFLLGGGAVGCSPVSMVTGGYKALKGASAYVYEIEPVTRDELRPYDSLETGTFDTDLEPLVPPRVVRFSELAMRNTFSAQLAEAFPGDGAVLVLNVTVRFFREKPLIGKEARLDWLVDFVDKESGKHIGKLYVEGVNTSLRELKPEEMGRKNTRELADFLRKRKAGEQ